MDGVSNKYINIKNVMTLQTNPIFDIKFLYLFHNFLFKDT
jgi:hypothetical protein